MDSNSAAPRLPLVPLVIGLMLAVAFPVMAAGGAAAPRQAPSPGQTGASRGVAPHADIVVLQTVRNLDAEQIALGRSALEQAYLPSVKAFADVVVDDAGDARDRLTQVLEDTRITLSPSQDAAALKEARDALAGKTGRAFDRAYVTLVAGTCTRAIDSVQGELSGAESPQVQAWAAAILPALRHQLELARELESRLGS